MKYEDIYKIAEEIVAKSTSEPMDAIDTHLASYFDSVADFDAFKKRFISSKRYDSIFEPTTNSQKVASLERLEQKLNRTNKMLIRKRVTYIASACAAAVLFFSFLLIDFTDSSDNVTTLTGASELLVSHSKEIHLIQDSKVVSISNKSGSVTVEGQTIAEVVNNSVDYSKLASTISEMATLVVPEQRRFKIILADGSSVYLFENSTLKYPSSFDGNIREVELTGSGYFDVAKSDKSFVVKHSGVEVVVYGTEFMLSDNSDGNYQATLVSGSMGVIHNNHETVLKPNERVTIDTLRGERELARDVDTRKEQARRDGFFRSDEAPLYLLMEELAKWYNVEIEYEDERFRNLEVSAYLSDELDVEDIMELVSTSTNVTVELNKKNIYIVKQPKAVLPMN